MKMPPLSETQQDDDLNEAYTEDTLIDSMTNSETLSSTSTWEKSESRSNWKLFAGISLVICGISMLFYTPFQLLMDQRTRMSPGLPPFDWWFYPPDEVLLKVYIFNVTNSKEFLSGIDRKIKIEEIGPIVYREKLIHTNAVFNENGTLTYTANRSTIYLPELNTINLNATLVMPNLGSLLIPVYFFDGPFFTKLAVNMMMRSMKSEPFVTTTIYKYLWNETDPMIQFSQQLAPGLVPTKNVGVLAQIYSDFVDDVTVYIGPTYGNSKFFGIDKYDGSEYIFGFGDKCHLKVVNSSEGLSYPQFLTKNDTLKYWRKSLCKVGELFYAKELEWYGLKALKYELSPATYNRTKPSNQDCHRGYPTLPNGLIDVSACNYDTSIAASFPHYLYADEVVKNYVDGLKPNAEKHQSFVIAEPTTGIPLHGIARSQINLVMKDMRGFNEKLQRFSNITIPLIWMEYNQVGIPWYIKWLIYFTVVLVPVFQKIFTVFFITLGLGFIIHYFRHIRRSKDNLIRNKTFKFETEQFLTSYNLKSKDIIVK